jgi:membrane-associated phospholipid phosphatase
MLDTLQTHWEALVPLFGAGLVALTTIGVAIGVTQRINQTTKRTEFFLGFTTRFHNINAAIHALEFDLSTNPVVPRKFDNDDVRRAAAYELYRQFFGLMFDEYFAYQRGFLGRDAFMEWMKWRNFDVRNFMILGVGYMEGWNNWVKLTPFKQHKFINFMEAVHEQDLAEAEIETLVLRHGPNSEPSVHAMLGFAVGIVTMLIVWILAEWVWKHQ